MQYKCQLVQYGLYTHMALHSYPTITQLEWLFSTTSSQDTYTLLNLVKTFQAVLDYISTSAKSKC